MLCFVLIINLKIRNNVYFNKFQMLCFVLIISLKIRNNFNFNEFQVLCFVLIINLKIRNARIIILNLIETYFNTFANRAEPDQAALVRAA